jgi:DNA processing protein
MSDIFPEPNTAPHPTLSQREREKLSSDEKLAWLRLTRTEGIGPITFHRLLARYKTASRALEALPHLTRSKPVVPYPADLAQKEIESTRKMGGTLIAACEESYPLSLAAIEDAPPILTVFGDPTLLQKPSIAIVGSRNASLNGRKFAAILARDLGEAGYVVTSGLARGIDTSAHEGALERGTVAVVAGGSDVVYPNENKDLYEDIKRKGSIVSECALGTQPLAQHFPKRNRIVSGLSVGTIIVEANLKSGSLITARMAGEQGRDVFAVPGFPFDPRSAGTNALIRDGATLIRSADDVLEQLRSFLHKSIEPPKTLLDGLEEEIDDFLGFTGDSCREILLERLSITPTGVDEIIRACNLKSAAVQGTLLELELEGLVQRLPGNRVCLAA